MAGAMEGTSTGGSAVTTSLPAIDLFSAPEAPRTGAGRDKNTGHAGSPFALELEKAQPSSDRGTSAHSTQDDADSNLANERTTAAKRQQNEERETNADRAERAERPERPEHDETTKADPDGAAENASDTEPRATADEPRAPSQPTADDAADAVDPDTNAPTVAPNSSEPARLPTQLDLEALLRIASEGAVDPAVRESAGAPTTAAPSVEVSNPPAAAVGTPTPPRAVRAEATPTDAAATATNAEPVAADAATTATREPTDADAAVPNSSDDDRTPRSEPLAAASSRDDAARAKSADVDFSGLDDGTDVRALLAQHAAQQRKVAAVSTGDSSFDRVESTRAKTQEVVAERAEHKSADDSARRGPNDGETRDASTQTESQARVERANVASTSTASPSLPTRGADTGMRVPNLVNASTSSQAIARGPGAPAAAAPSAMAHSVPIQAILAQVRQQVRGGAHAINLRLDPAELGRLTLRFRMEGDQLHVAVRASRPEVVEALRADLSAFADTLRDAGIDLTGLDIDLAAPRDGDSAPAFADLLGESGSHGASRRDPELTTADLDEPSRSRAHDGLVDILA